MEEKMERTLSCFMNETEYDFEEYIGEHAIKFLEKNKEYARLNQEIKDIYENHPRIRVLMEDEKAVALDEVDAIAFDSLLTFLDEKKQMEMKQIFKLGAKEAYIFFEEQDMLNI